MLLTIHQSHYDLNRAQFKILGILNEMGLENSSKILTNVGYNKDDINRAVSVYQSIQSSNNISTP